MVERGVFAFLEVVTRHNRPHPHGLRFAFGAAPGPPTICQIPYFGPNPRPVDSQRESRELTSLGLRRSNDVMASTQRQQPRLVLDGMET